MKSRGGHVKGGVTPLKWNAQSKVMQEVIQILAPGDRNGGGAKRILQDEVPSDNPGDEFAESRIGVSVGASRNGNHSRQFRITKAGESTSDACQDEGIDDSRARVVSRGS